ncbi:hypothetical protein BDP27DRAFT_1332393 [Rhodocollybia butyracea]|uniref:F-box domain-containing protein n=1 Tax=Rhodocollybia butyracea TaxID=206335 RepID=A0A9P5PNC3_9AGAR|nr:hypothetical protein BDP27DRAFT_1332393 [Rhodocollybia butyracea]
MSSNVDARSTSESSQLNPLLLSYQKDYTETLTKIRSNDIPSSSDEKDELHARIVRARNDLDSCTEDTICAHILKTLELQESLLAPIRTLPSEILHEIFQLVVRTSLKTGLKVGIRYASGNQKSRKLSGTAFLFTWVCICWRNEAISQPALWSCIDVQFRYINLQHHSFEALELLKECILRSGSYAPMDVRIGLDYSNHQAISPACLDILEMLLGRADRWRTLRLNAFGRSNFPRQIIDLFDAKHARAPSVPLFPLLEDLELTLRRYKPPSLAPMFHYFPPLRSLDIPSLFESDTLNFDVLWKLRVGVYNGHSLAGLLRRCPSLKYLKVSRFASQHRSTWTTSSINTQVISHPLLSRLEVGNIDKNFRYGAWSFVCLPSLTQLDVSVNSEEEDLEAPVELRAPLIELKEMIQRSKCTLEKVNLILPELDTTPPDVALETAEKFFEDFPAPYLSLRVDHMPWPDWRQVQEDVQEDLEADMMMFGDEADEFWDSSGTEY